MPYSFPPMTAKGRPASVGSGSPSFTVRVPFRLFPVGRFPDARDLPLHATFPLATRYGEAIVEKYDAFYVLRVPGFSSDEDAHDALKRISVGLLRLKVEREIGVQFEPTPSPLDVAGGPHNRRIRESHAEQCWPQWKAADGSYTDYGMPSNWTTIIPEHMRVWEYFAPSPQEVKLLDPGWLAEAIDVDYTLTHAVRILSDPKLLTAIDAYGAAHNLWLHSMRFLLLVTAMESVLPRAKRSEYSQRIIIKLTKAIRALKPKGEDKREQLSQFLNDIHNLEEKSFGSELRELVRSTLSEAARQRIGTEPGSAMSNIYGVRSQIVHKGAPAAKGRKSGRTRMMDALEELRVISRDILLAKLDGSERSQ